MYPYDLRHLLVGLGLDKSEDEILRITRGQGFFLVGGSKPTHENMQEICIRFGEEAQKRSKRLGDLTPDEFLEISMKLGLRPPPARRFPIPPPES